MRLVYAFVFAAIYFWVFPLGAQTTSSEPRSGPCAGSGCKQKYCCIAHQDGVSYWAPRSKRDRFDPRTNPWVVINPPVR